MQTHLAETARILCTLLLSSLAGAALAQSAATQPEDAAPPARYVWTGTQVRDGGRFGEPPEIAVTATKTGNTTATTRTSPRRRTEELLAELARVELSIEVDRRFDDARARL